MNFPHDMHITPETSVMEIWDAFALWLEEHGLDYRQETRARMFGISKRTASRLDNAYCPDHLQTVLMYAICAMARTVVEQVPQMRGKYDLATLERLDGGMSIRELSSLKLAN